MTTEPTETSLEDLLSGKERLLTAGEVAEILNVNVNTLYLWRASGEVDLPFHKFIQPGQTRGMIRYRYSDVQKFLDAALKRGQEDSPIKPEDAERLAKAGERIAASSKKAARGRASKAKKTLAEKLEKPLEETLTQRFQPTFVPVPEDLDEQDAPHIEVAKPTNPFAAPPADVEPVITDDQRAAAKAYLDEFLGRGE